MDYRKELFDIERFRNEGHQLVDQLAEYLHDAISGKPMPVLDWKDPENQVAFWENYDINPDNLKPFFEEVIKRSIHLHHPNYVGHQLTPTAPVTILAGFLAAALNNGMVGYEMGSVTTAMERIVVREFCRMLGYGEKGDGFLTSGGTLANLTALLTARKLRVDDDVWRDGTKGKRLAVMVSSQAHYCVDRAVRIMGLGDDGIIPVAVDETFSMDVSTLNEAYTKATEQGIEVFAIVGSACTTATGSYDNLKAIANFAVQKSIWFHVDGAHGGTAVFSKRYRYLVEGLEQADSVVLDCHKLLLAPALTTMVLYKEAQDSYRTFQQDAAYLWEKGAQPEWFNYGQRTMECTKLMMSLKLFTLLRTHGTDFAGEHLDLLYDLARTFANMIREKANFELATEPQSNIVCFRVVHPDWDLQKTNSINQKVRENMLRDGTFYIVQTTLDDKLYLRTTLMNPFTTSDHLGILLDQIELFIN
jgi:L-2,4-diaminobutyrate decarboxylase